MEYNIPLDDLKIEDEDVVNENATESVFDLAIEKHKGKEEDDVKPWIDAYKKLMEQSIDQFHTLLACKFKLVSTIMDNKICLYERDNGVAYGFYTWKVSGVFNLYADRLFYVIKDFNRNTRLKWDNEFVESVDELETFDTEFGLIKMCKLEEKYNLPLFWNRVHLGIGWKHFNKTTNTYKFVFRTTQHRFYKCPEKKVKVISLFGVVVRVLETPNKCECQMIQYMNPGDSVPASVIQILKNRFLNKLKLYAEVTKDWDKYYKK